MAEDLGTMETRIRRELSRTGLTADIRDAVVSAIKFYEGDRYEFNEDSATASTVTGDPFVSAPTNFIAIDSIKLVSSGQERVLDEENAIELDERWETTAEPTAYAVFKNRLRLHPTPDKVYEMRIMYHKTLPEISASASASSINAWTTAAETLIRTKAKEYINDHVLRNYKAGQTMRGLAAAEWTRLVKKSRRKTGRGRIVAMRF